VTGSGPVFEALGDPTRREVVRRLAEGGPASATQLAAELPVSRQAVAKHLAALEEAGLVTGERSGRERRFRLTPAPFSEAVAWMVDVGAEWDRRLDRLRKRLGG
jgi:DNA-binding transcriptional ArsR family regulator